MFTLSVWLANIYMFLDLITRGNVTEAVRLDVGSAQRRG